MMDMESRNQYLKTLREEYLKVSKKKKSKLLDEAEKRTELNRKHLIVKLRPLSNLDKLKSERKRRKEYYDGQLKEALVKVWEIFDRPCGQRLVSMLEDEVDRLRTKNELSCSDEVTSKLKQISPASIDSKLKHTKEVLQIGQIRKPSVHPLLYQKIPVKLMDEWNRKEPGHSQIDYVAHCGRSAFGDFIYTLASIDIASGWWEGEAQLGRSQRFTHDSLNKIESRLPFTLREIHPDNDSGIINELIYLWTKVEKIDFSRSRPNKKNDNAFIEQKNRTHVRRYLGHLRYDTEEELKIIRSLYRNELRLYKNFFQPVIKLISKERIKGKIKRKYDKAKTPYKRIMESDQIDKKTKRELKAIYESLNPAKLKRSIDAKLDKLYRIYEKKNNIPKANPLKKQIPNTVRNYIIQPEAVRLES